MVPSISKLHIAHLLVIKPVVTLPASLSFGAVQFGGRRSFAIVIITINRSIVVVVFTVTALRLVRSTERSALAITVGAVNFVVVVVVLTVAYVGVYMPGGDQTATAIITV